MGAAKQDFNIEQGATFGPVLTFKTSLSVAIDLTGCVFRGQIRKTATSTTVLATLNFQLFNQSTDAGKVKVFLTAAETSAIPVRSDASPTRSTTLYAYDIERILSDGVTVERVLEGVIKVSPEATR